MLYGLRDLSSKNIKKYYFITTKYLGLTNTIMALGTDVVIYFFESYETANRVIDELNTIFTGKYNFKIQEVNEDDLPYFYQSCFGGNQDLMMLGIKMLIVKEDDYFILPSTTVLLPLDD